jgi:hypothetical protein
LTLHASSEAFDLISVEMGSGTVDCSIRTLTASVTRHGKNDVLGLRDIPNRFVGPVFSTGCGCWNETLPIVCHKQRLLVHGDKIDIRRKKQKTQRRRNWTVRNDRTLSHFRIIAKLRREVSWLSDTNEFGKRVPLKNLAKSFPQWSWRSPN